MNTYDVTTFIASIVAPVLIFKLLWWFFGKLVQLLIMKVIICAGIVGIVYVSLYYSDYYNNISIIGTAASLIPIVLMIRKGIREQM